MKHNQNNANTRSITFQKEDSKNNGPANDKNTN